MRAVLAILLLCVLLVNCKPKEETPKNVVAKVYDYVLTADEIRSQIPKTNSVVDSLELVKNYIKEWSNQKLLYRNALINLDNTDELDALVKKYKEELYVSYYKNGLVNKKLDTLIFEKEIQNYYTNHQSIFKLNEALILFRYIHLNGANSKLKEIKKLFLSDSLEDKQKIIANYTELQDYYLNDSAWVSLKNVYLKKTNFPVLSPSDLIRRNKLIQKKVEDKSVYLIYIKQRLDRGDIAPIEYVKPTIKNILLHKNKIKFFNQMEQILIEDAVKQKKYEVY